MISQFCVSHHNYEIVHERRACGTKLVVIYSWAIIKQHSNKNVNKWDVFRKSF